MSSSPEFRAIGSRDTRNTGVASKVVEERQVQFQPVTRQVGFVGDKNTSFLNNLRKLVR